MGLTSKTKKLLVFGIIGVSLLLILGYGWWSYNAWANYKINVESHRTSVKEEVSAVFALPVSSEEEHVSKLEKLEALSQPLGGFSSVCGASWFFEWQAKGAYKEAAEAVSGCRTHAQRASELKVEIDNVTAYIKDDAAIAKLTASLGSKEEYAEGEFAAQAGAWREASKQVQALTVSEAYTQVKTTAERSYATIADAWQEVQAAHEARNKANYIKAQEKLQTAYDSLQAISNESQKYLSNMSLHAQTSYEAF